MSGSEQLNIDVTAKDSASKVLDAIQKDVDKLDKSDPEIEIGADAKKADHTVDGLADQLDRLTNDDKVVVLALRAGAAQTELRELAGDLATIDAADPDVDVKFARYAEVSGQLEQLEGQIKQIGNAGDELDKPRQKLEQLGESAGQTQGAVHSMAGNAVGDFAATTSGVGPLGEAIGQLTEVAAAGETSLKGLAVAGLGLGAISAGILVLNTIMKRFADAAEHAAAIRAFNVKQVEDYTAAVIAAKKALDAAAGVELVDPIPAGVNARMKDLNARTTELVGLWEKAGKVEVFDPQGDKIVDLTSKLAAANITAEDYAKAVIEGGVANNALATAARKAGLDQDTAAQITRTAAAEYVKYHEAMGDAEDQAIVFSRAQTTASSAMAAGALKAAALGGAVDKATVEVDHMKLAYDGLTSSFSDEAAWRNVQDGFANAEAAMKTAKTATDDQAGAIRDARQAQLDQILAVQQYAQEVLQLPPQQVTEIIAAVNRGDLAEAERLLDNATKTRTAWIDVQVKALTGALTGALVNFAGSGGLPVGTSTTVNNFGAGPGALPSLSSVAAPARWARLNGRG